MRILLVVMVAIVAVCGVACGERQGSADKEMAQKTEQLMQEVNAQIGMPEIVNFQQRKLMKMIYEQADREDLVCYAYIKSDYQGTLCYIGRCMGYGVPFSAQYTNPSRVVRGYQTSLGIPQPDPNGLFMPTSSSATWLMMIDPETNVPRPVYLEPEIVVSPFALH